MLVQLFGWVDIVNGEEAKAAATTTPTMKPNMRTMTTTTKTINQYDGG